MKFLATGFLALLCAPLTTTQCDAQDNYPSRSVRVIVPYAPGGTTDIVARILASDLQNRLGQTFLVENKPGADGIGAINELVRSGGDGYTVTIGNVATNAIIPILYSSKMSVNYDSRSCR
jgi:tripartite-type tricarboxylate transporter receptor subunit TctC